MSGGRQLERKIADNRRRSVPRQSPQEEAVAWGRATRAKFLSAIGPEAYAERAEEIRSRIEQIAASDGVDRLEAALRFEAIARKRLSETEAKVWGAFILAIGIEEKTR